MLFSRVPMHIPDGFLSLVVALVFWIPAVAVVGMALKRTGKEVGERQVPLMGVLAAAIFAGQMLNFTVAGGTSGHLLGAALATILVGPWSAILVMTSVVVVQALVFQDGGVLALGANLFNMAIIGVSVAYLVYNLVRKLAGGRDWGVLLGGPLAAWASIFVASLSAALQLALSGTSPANLAVPAMAGIHALIGIGEGLITFGALAFLRTARRDLFQPGAGQARFSPGMLIGGLVITLALAVASPLASTHPDGLEWVAEQQGFIHHALAPAFKVIPDYLVPGIRNESLATILAGMLGAAIVFGVMFVGARLRRRNCAE